VGGPRNHEIGDGLDTPGKGHSGAFSSPLKSTDSVRHEPKLIARWQQRCGLSLSVLQRLADVATALISIKLYVSMSDMRAYRYMRQALVYLLHRSRAKQTDAIARTAVCHVHVGVKNRLLLLRGMRTLEEVLKR